MASKNSINKPKGKLHRAAHANRLGQKRAARAKLAAPTRSSHGRYNVDTVPRPTDSKALALYSGTGPSACTRAVTTNILSKKRARKIERNARYIAKRKLQLDADLAAQEGMDVDRETIGKRQKEVKPETKLEKVKKALWTAVADASAERLALEVSGEGTTLGIQAF